MLRSLLAQAVALAVLAPHSSTAEPLLFTLTGVTFNDGAIAEGSFILDPSTQVYGAFNITTGVGFDPFHIGSNYGTVAGTTTQYFPGAGGFPDAFIFNNMAFDGHALALGLFGDIHISGPGTYTLNRGQSAGPGIFDLSGEFVNMNSATINYRLLTNGSLIVTDIVPEPASWILATMGLVVGMSYFYRRRLVLDIAARGCADR
jgi:hypothetical protein